MATKNQSNSPQQFDFTKNFEPKDTLGKFIKNAVLAFHYKVNYKEIRQWILRIIIVVVIGFLVTSGINLLSVKNSNDAKIELAQLAQKEKDIKVAMPQNIRAIKTIQAQDFAKTIEFIKLIQAKQEKRLVDFYWNSQYAASQDRYFDIKEATGKASSARSEMHKYYNDQISIISKTYNAVQRGDTEFSTPSALEQVVYWNDAMHNNLQVNLDSVDKLMNKWDEKFTDKQGFSKYLESNKNIINNLQPYH